MSISEITVALDREIGKLKQARTLLSGSAASHTGHRRGRPHASAAHAASHPAKTTHTRRRKLSPEGRRRIAAAARKRWAAHRKSAATR